jgi:Cellulase (glycosyl hydrolase family 5)
VLLAGGLMADQAVTEWKRLGVDTVRVFAQWSKIAPSIHSKQRPAGFDGADPASAGYRWGALDKAIDRVQGAGMRVLLNVTGPGPLWSSTAPVRRNPRYRPRPSDYGDFAAAVAERYGDTVDEYILYNEPNLPAWLQPQSSCSHRHCTPVSPHVYRNLVRAAYPAIHAVDPTARVLIGALAPRGSNGRSANANVKPLTFIRAMACVDRSYRPIRSGACRSFHSAIGDGFAYHPHSVTLSPSTPYPDRDDIDLASLSRLEHVLDLLQSRGRLRASTPRFNLWLDEFGYQTDPPDQILGVSPATQDRWLQESFYRAWRDPRVKLLVQYGWRDEPASANGTYSGWQAGLRYANLRPKPALSHFARTAASAHGKRAWAKAARGRR